MCTYVQKCVFVLSTQTELVSPSLLDELEGEVVGKECLGIATDAYLQAEEERQIEM